MIDDDDDGYGDNDDDDYDDDDDDDDDFGARQPTFPMRKGCCHNIFTCQRFSCKNCSRRIAQGSGHQHRAKTTSVMFTLLVLRFSHKEADSFKA